MRKHAKTLVNLLIPALFAFAVSVPCLVGTDKSKLIILLGTVGAPIMGLLCMKAMLKKKVPTNANTVCFMILTIVLAGGGWYWIDDLVKTNLVFLLLPATMTMIVGTCIGTVKKLRNGLIAAVGFAVMFIVMWGGYIFSSTKTNLEPTLSNIAILLSVAIFTGSWSIWRSYEVKTRTIKERDKP